MDETCLGVSCYVEYALGSKVGHNRVQSAGLPLFETGTELWYRDSIPILATYVCCSQHSNIASCEDSAKLTRDYGNGTFRKQTHQWRVLWYYKLKSIE